MAQRTDKQRHKELIARPQAEAAEVPMARVNFEFFDRQVDCV